MTKALKDIAELNYLFSQPTLHPMVSVGKLVSASPALFEQAEWDMYCVVMMDSECGILMKNGKQVRYKEGTVFTIMPGQVVSLEVEVGRKPQGWLLAFRPELLIKTGLGRDFYMFSFFSHDLSEALNLSPDERKVLQNCFANISAELCSPDDHLTGHMLRLGIGQMLSYCKRFYERQFNTQRRAGSGIQQKLDTMLNNYLSSGLPEQKGQPTVAWCAEQFHWTPNYFGDVVRRELHITAQEYIQGKIIEAASSMLAGTDMAVTAIAQQLGFAYPNHFTRLFRRKAGMSPTEYRRKRSS